MRTADPIRSFFADENGAVTADWVVLTAAVVGLAAAAFTAVSGGVMKAADEIAHVMGVHLHVEGENYQ
jgi:Flp pilus assembly pilin Flp